MKHLGLGRSDLAERRRDGDSLDQRFAVVMLLASGQVFSGHRPVESHPPETAVEVKAERGHVAVADEYFRAPADQVFIEQVEQAHRAVSAARGPHGFDFRVGEGPRQFGGAAAVIARGVAGFVENPRLVSRPKVQSFEFGHAAREVIGLQIARGGDDGDGVAGAQSRWFDYWRWLNHIRAFFIWM